MNRRKLDDQTTNAQKYVSILLLAVVATCMRVGFLDFPLQFCYLLDVYVW
jgi:hypothetical protein